MKTVRAHKLIRLILCGLAVASPPLVQNLAAEDLSGTSVTISADAFDNVAVVGVQFFLNGNPLGPEDTTPPYAMTWDTTTVPDGSYLLTARARDAAGNEGLSTPVTITVNNGGGGDTTPPNVVTTSPASGATVSEVVPITAAASDDVGVAGVQFFVDGSPLGPEDTTPPYAASWNTGSHSNGAHVVTSRARDAAGNQATAAGVTVIVDNASSETSTGGESPPTRDTIAPTVQTTGPAHGSSLSGAVSVTATASDNVGVAAVQFLLDGVPIAVADEIAPYSVGWDTRTATNGNHVLSALARDAAGNQTISDGILVTLVNPTSESESSESPEDADEDADPVSIEGTAGLSIEPASPGVRVIRSHSDTGDALTLYLDGQAIATAAGRDLEYEWDVRPLLGTHEVRVVAMSEGDAVASTSLFYSVASTRIPRVVLEVVEMPIVGATFVKGMADVAGATRLELYIDGELRATRLASELEHAWEPGTGSHEIVFAALDSLGVVASVTAVYLPK